ncbi:FAD-dependent monooxygenase [Virgisporangium aurantiacum]|uniref:2-polyprenyl-6-methoxyphenol hydroxylase n=1 Tax=Virgisporangium aurantiacum TaxID=175570 RepID=A0A8J3ZI00_9ACTN|nr:FAD-dependent monooxygenase [Virgisporangium aurantiacum]GIJ64472.1 2-polyprenyl-6-methoxyphenol hydroxylase [Virgisporangium aurantiacum]
MSNKLHHSTPRCGFRRLRIAVVGGSLTGPTVALLLLQAGFERVSIFEAVPGGCAQTGGLIGVEHSTLDVLDRLGIGQDEFVHHRSEHIMHTRIRPGHAETIRRVYPGRNTTWTLLHAALAARVPATILRSGLRVTGLHAHHGTHDGSPVLAFVDGATEPADLVVFADGRASTGRALLDPDRHIRYAGYVAHRGTAPATPALTDFERFEPCPGVQFNIAPIPDGADWTFYLNATPRQYAGMFGAPPHRRPFVLPRYVSRAAREHVDRAATDLAGAGLTGTYAAAVHDTGRRMAVAVADIDPPRQMVWTVGDGYAVLLGDALAPVRPHTARGLNNGIEQAAGLVAALTQVGKYGADLGAALAGWQRRHLPAAVAAVRLGPVIGGRLGLGLSRQDDRVPTAAGSLR